MTHSRMDSLRTRPFCLLFGAVSLLTACNKKSSSEKSQVAAAPQAISGSKNFGKGLLFALSQFEIGPDGKATSKPKAARLELARFKSGKWQVESFEDAESNVFHKAIASADHEIITLGGMAAKVKRWKNEAGKWTPEVLWQADFGGKWNRMRDAEVADVFGDGQKVLAVATHDQGVVEIVRPKSKGADVIELDRKPNTFVHEIEIGDLNGDGVKEVYATPSEPNKLDGSTQTGEVVRYVPKTKVGRAVVAKFANRHAKEILVGDVDGDGRDELYVSVEAETQGEGGNLSIKTPVEIQRFDADTKADKGQVVARINDRLCRFLTAGDIDGDGKKEMIAAAFRSGLWLLRPGKSPKDAWVVTNIDANSSGFEHAALLADLDGDKKAELYVASDDQGEVRQYRFENGAFVKTVMWTRPVPGAVMTWNITVY